MRTNLDNMKGKTILIVGLGLSGRAAAQAMLDLGAKVYVQDIRRESDFEPGLVAFFRGKSVGCFFGIEPYDMSLFDMIILSPGVSPELGFIERGREAGAEITGELEIAYRISRGNFVAITGTNGKTTTTTLTGEIFKNSGRRTYVAGNIGTAVISAAATADENDWLVTETSSFQLETTRYFRPVVSAVLNITPDHLNRHRTMEAYAGAKAKVFANQSGESYLVINDDDEICRRLAETAGCRIARFSRLHEVGSGACLKNGRLTICDEGKSIDLCGADELLIIGDHNIENALAAAAISYFAGIGPDVIGRTIKVFAGVEHRIEYCGTVDGVKYYNDSKGTNIDASLTAIRALKKNIILIAGGDAKGQVFDTFIAQFGGAVKRMLVLGRDGKLITDAADRNGFTDYEVCRDLPECVRRAGQTAGEGDSVLLSPACASWDMYDNYEQRGRHFKDCVALLSK